MRSDLFFASALTLISLAACGDPEPVSTGTKAPGLNRAAATQSTDTVTGDASKGEAALTASCNSCHGTPTAHALNKNDVGVIDSAGAKSYHNSVAAVFKTSGPDIKAYLATK